MVLLSALSPLSARSFIGQSGLTRWFFQQCTVLHLFVVYGYQCAEQDWEQLALFYRVLSAVLVEAQVVAVG